MGLRDRQIGFFRNISIYNDSELLYGALILFSCTNMALDDASKLALFSIILGVLSMVTCVIEVRPITTKLSFSPLNASIQALWYRRRSSSTFIHVLESSSESDIPIGETASCPGVCLPIDPCHCHCRGDRSYRCRRPLHSQEANH